MKLKSMLIILLSFALLPAFAQQTPAAYSVKGIVSDSASNKPADYITVSLKNTAKQVIRTLATKEDGKFTFEKLAAGKYTVTIISVEYVPKVVAVDLTDNTKPAADLGTILIAPKVNQLAAVVVLADKPIIKQEVDKISYDLQADPESKSNSVLDMMRKVPLISVDAEDNILLKGQAGYKILINGKPSSMMERDAKNILKGMPASTIQSIEVITNPPAKYDAEGIAGIINIVTNKKVDNGYNASLNASHKFPVGGPGVGGSFAFKQGKFGMSGFGGANTSHSPATRTSIIRTTSGNSSTNLNQNNGRESDDQSGYFGTELSYEIDSLNLISGQFNINGNNSDGLSSQNSLLNNSGGLMQTYDLANVNNGHGQGLDGALNYQLGFKSNKARLLTFSYRYFGFNNEQRSNLGVSNRLNYATPDYRQFNESKASEQTFQIDYVHPVKKLNIEAGVKGILRENNSDFQYRSFNSTNSLFELDPSRTNTFGNIQNVFGAYNSYQYNLKNWGFKAGVRIEETIIDADFISTGSSVKQDYFNITPSININRSFKDKSSLNVAYSRRIQRPGIYQLNPFVDRSNPSFESAGNPNLRPSVGNDFRINYNKSKKISFNASFRVNWIKTMIMPTSAFDPATNITRSSFGNTGKALAYGADFNVNYPVTKVWSVSANGRLIHGQVRGLVNGAEIRNSGLMYGGSASSTYRLEKGWRLSGNAYLNGPSLSIQGTSNPYVAVSLSANKDIVKDKLSFSASINNPFTKYRTNRVESFGPDFTQTNNNQQYFRGISTSLNYRFGKLKEAIKKNKRGISNDDVSNGG
ncbi:DUF2012 domain-containing protein [Daejeonella sp.]|uniref:beta-sandwich domain-containing protein n=1 Tax=Daejeonella sp. TaxID=2805397 RepID=UPI0030BCCF99